MGFEKAPDTKKEEPKTFSELAEELRMITSQLRTVDPRTEEGKLRQEIVVKAERLSTLPDSFEEDIVKERGLYLDEIGKALEEFGTSDKLDETANEKISDIIKQLRQRNVSGVF